MTLLSSIDSPSDYKELSVEELTILSEEIRDYLIEVIPSIGGHFASSLGVVELTVALHYIYDAPKDKFIFDVGHQGYVHKLLTGRREALKHIRQFGGISGFLKPSESPYDAFGAGHASTAISAALGIAKARDLRNKDYRVLAVVGDGSMTGGLAYEGLNNAGGASTNITVILNDNEMSISRNVGAISRYLVNMVSNPHYQNLRAKIWDFTGKMPHPDRIRTWAKKLEESIKTIVNPGMLFENLGFRYFGPVDGHDINELINIFRNIKDLPGPQLLHVTTTKGKGFEAAEENPTEYHGVKASIKQPSESQNTNPAYLKIFGSALTEIAEKDDEVVAITAAMTEGTGLEDFAEKFPDRFFDVGIAEGHAATFAAGMATEGMRPVCAIYSTFMQRAFDHLMHDIALQKLPVVICMDRAGVVGEDGPTHHGCLDLSFIGCLPGVVVAAPKDGRELRNLLYSAVYYDMGPFTIRYPKDRVPDDDWHGPFEKIPVGSWELVREGADILILAVGSMVHPSLAAAGILQEDGLKTGVVNARFVKPLDKEFLKKNIGNYSTVVTIEENALEGGFGDRISRYFIEQKWKTDSLFSFGLPDNYITHGSRSQLLDLVGLTPEQIARRITKLLKTKKHVRPVI
ncbi:1-deoxy-D-xylulose-5-phosphate synthase [candidate division KSB1 bacterium]